MVLIIVPAEVPSKCEVPGRARGGGGMVMGDGAGACIAWCYYVRTPPTYDSVVVGNKKTRNFIPT